MIRNRDDLHGAYDDSGEMLMHLQKAVDGFEVFARALTIGPETMVMKFQPDEPMHNRYAVQHGFLSEARGRRGGHHRADRECLLPLGVQLLRDARQGRRGLPDRLRQRLSRRRGDLAALLLPVGHEGPAALVGVLPATGRRPRTQVDTGPWFEVADDEALDYRSKLGAYQRLADEYFEHGPLPGVLRRGAAPRRRDGAGVGGLEDFRKL